MCVYEAVFSGLHKYCCCQLHTTTVSCWWWWHQ